VKALRAARDAAMKAAQKKAEMMQAITHAAPAAAKAAKDASDIDTGGGLNALEVASGMGGAAPGATGLPQ
jgi:hypothetical protein